MNKKIIKLLSLALVSTLIAGCDFGKKRSQSNSSVNASENVSSGTNASSESSLSSGFVYSDSSTSKGNSSAANSSASSTSTSTSTSKSSSSSQSGPQWPSDVQTLMRKHCGEVLPYVEFATKGFYAGENTDENGEKFLVMYDEASSLTIENYYQALENAGWTVELEDGSPVLLDENGDEFYSIHKIGNNGKDFYGVQYWYDEGNYLTAWHVSMVNELTDDTAWSADATEKMVTTLGEALPFMKFAKGYEVAAANGQVQISDNYYLDLTDDYEALLAKNGYVSAGEDDYGQPLLLKTLASGTKILVNPYYVNGFGNVINAYFMPDETTVNTWPSDVVAPFEDATGYSIPSYQASSYTYYIYNDELTIYSSLKTSLEDSYAEALETAGLIVSDNEAISFEETLFIKFEDEGEYDDSFNFDVEGFKITIALTEAVSNFAQTFPEKLVNDYVKGIDADHTAVLPTVQDPNNPHKNIKYYQIEMSEDLVEEIYESNYAAYVQWGLYSEAEAREMAETEASGYVGFYVEVYDPNGTAINEFLNKALDNSNLYVQGPDDNSGFYVETSSGKVGFYFYNANNVLNIQYFTGAGTAHERSLSLNKDKVTLKPGSTFQLEVVLEMIPSSNTITFESSAPAVATVSNTGLISVPSNITEGTTTIKVSTVFEGQTYEASCVVTVKNSSTTVKITASHCPSKYSESDVEVTLNGLTMKASNIMNQKGKIQLKSNLGRMYNTVAYEPITSITFENYSGSALSVSAGTSSSSLTKITGESDLSGKTVVYNLDGATFFKIENGKGVFTCDSITFEF